MSTSNADDFGPARVYLHRFSSLDNSEFSTYLNVELFEFKMPQGLSSSATLLQNN